MCVVRLDGVLGYCFPYPNTFCSSSGSGDYFRLLSEQLMALAVETDQFVLDYQAFGTFVASDHWLVLFLCPFQLLLPIVTLHFVGSISVEAFSRYCRAPSSNNRFFQ